MQESLDRREESIDNIIAWGELDVCLQRLLEPLED